MRDASGEPLPDPDFWRRMSYHVLLYLDGVWLGTLGANSDDLLRWLLRTVALRSASEPGRNVQVQIWDTRREHWCRGDGSPGADGWDGVMSIETGVHVGSANL